MKFVSNLNEIHLIEREFCCVVAEKKKYSKHCVKHLRVCTNLC